MHLGLGDGAGRIRLHAEGFDERDGCFGHGDDVSHLDLDDGYISFSRLPFVSLLFSAICKASSDNHFAFFAFLFLGDGLDHSKNSLSLKSPVLDPTYFPYQAD